MTFETDERNSYFLAHIDIHPAFKSADVTQDVHQDVHQDVPQDVHQDNLDKWIEEQIRYNPNVTIKELGKMIGVDTNMYTSNQIHPKQKADVDSWSDEVFLNKAKITIDGKITNTAILLLGKPESLHYINYIGEIVWRLADKDNVGQVFSIPFLLTTTERWSIPSIRGWRIRSARHYCLIHSKITTA